MHSKLTFSPTTLPKLLLLSPVVISLSKSNFIYQHLVDLWPLSPPKNISSLGFQDTNSPGYFFSLSLWWLFLCPLDCFFSLCPWALKLAVPKTQSLNLFLSFSFLSNLFCCHSLHDLIQYHVYKHYLYISDFQIRPVQISSLNFRLIYPDAYMTSLCTYLIGGSGLPGPKHLISPPPPNTCLPESPSSQLMVTPSLRLFRPKISTPFSPTPYTQFVRKSFSFIFKIYPELIACYTSTATQLFSTAPSPLTWKIAKASKLVSLLPPAHSLSSAQPG